MAWAVQLRLLNRHDRGETTAMAHMGVSKHQWALIWTQTSRTLLKDTHKKEPPPFMETATCSQGHPQHVTFFPCSIPEGTHY